MSLQLSGTVCDNLVKRGKGNVRLCRSQVDRVDDRLVIACSCLSIQRSLLLCIWNVRRTRHGVSCRLSCCGEPVVSRLHCVIPVDKVSILEIFMTSYIRFVVLVKVRLLLYGIAIVDRGFHSLDDYIKLCKSMDACPQIFPDWSQLVLYVSENSSEETVKHGQTCLLWWVDCGCDCLFSNAKV